MLCPGGNWRTPLSLALALLLAPGASGAQGTAAPATECPAPAATERPGSFPEYREGYRLYKIEAWEEAAEAFWASLCRWPEDGETVRISGRWYLPYIPRYYLGTALNALGCGHAALQSLETSVLSAGPVYRGEDEARHWSTLVLELQARTLSSPPVGGLCATWRQRLSSLTPDSPGDFPRAVPITYRHAFHLAVNPPGNRLAVIDVVPGKVLQWRRTKAGDWVPDPLPTTPEIERPTALLYTLDGALLVVQASGKIIEFPPEEKTTKQH
jgi:hypothetical protein